MRSMIPIAAKRSKRRATFSTSAKGDRRSGNNVKNINELKIASQIRRLYSSK